MPVNSANVFIGAPEQEVTGALLTGPETDVIPETIDDFVFTGLAEAGYVSEEGVKISVDESTESIRDWSRRVVREITSEFGGNLEWEHLELSEEAAKNYFGDTKVTVSGTKSRYALSGDNRETKAWYFKMKDGQRRALVFVPHGQVTERGEIELVADDAIKLPVTLSTYPDAAGNNLYFYTDTGVIAATVPPPTP